MLFALEKYMPGIGSAGIFTKYPITLGSSMSLAGQKTIGSNRDITPDIERAIGEGHDAIFIAPGDYTLSHTIVLPTGFKLHATPGTVTITAIDNFSAIKPTGMREAMIVNKASTLTGQANYSTVDSRITISGINFDANTLGQSGKLCCICIQYTSHARVADCKFRNAGEAKVSEIGTNKESQSVWLRNCINSSIYNSQEDACDGFTISLSKDCVIDTCWSYNSTSEGFFFGANYRCRVINCSTFNGKGAGVIVSGSGLTCYDCEVVNFYAEGHGNSYELDTYLSGVSIGDKAYRTKVVNATCVGCYDSGIKVYNSEDTFITNAMCWNNGQGAGSSYKNGISIAGTSKRVFINGAILRNNVGSGLSINGCTDAMISAIKTYENGTYGIAQSDSTNIALSGIDSHSNTLSQTYGPVKISNEPESVGTYTVGLTGSGADYIAGASSQQTAFQSAITAAEALIASNNQAVIIKVLPGLYDQISNTINLTPKYAHLLYIQGSGRDRTILKKMNNASGGSKIFGYSTPTYSTTPGSDSQNFAYQGGFGFHLSDITLDGNGANQTSGSPISLAGCQDFNLERVKIYDGYQFQSYLKGASGRQILLSDGTTNATVTTVRGSNFISLTTGTADFTTQVSVGDKLRVATTATPDNTNGSDSDYAFDSADVIAVTATRIQLAAPWPHDSTSGRQARFFKPNSVNSKDLWYENRTGFTATDDSWGGGAFEGQLTNITVKNSGGYGIGMTGSGAFIVSGVTIRGGVKGIGMERCYGSTQVSNFDIKGCSSAGLWVVNGNYRTMFSNGVIRACSGNGIDEKVVSVSSDGGFIKSGNIGVVFQNIQIYDSGTHGARITGDGITLRGVKCINNAVSAAAAGIALVSDTVGSLTLNAPNVSLIDCECIDTRSGSDRTQDYGLWILNGAGTGISTQNILCKNSTTKDYKDDNSTPYAIDVGGWRGTVPATATAAGITGQIAYDSGYVYICTATNTWKRAALSTW